MYTYLKKKNIINIKFETKFHFETLIFLRIWDFFKKNNFIDFDNYICKLNIYAQTDLNFKCRQFMKPVFSKIEILSVIDSKKTDILLQYISDLNFWLEQYNEDAACLSEFYIDITFLSLSYEKNDIIFFNEINKYLIFYNKFLKAYSQNFALQNNRIAQYIWSFVVIFFLKVLTNAGFSSNINSFLINVGYYLISLVCYFIQKVNFF